MADNSSRVMEFPNEGPDRSNSVSGRTFNYAEAKVREIQCSASSRDEGILFHREKQDHLMSMINKQVLEIQEQRKGFLCSVARLQFRSLGQGGTWCPTWLVDFDISTSSSIDPISL